MYLILRRTRTDIGKFEVSALCLWLIKRTAPRTDLNRPSEMKSLILSSVDLKKLPLLEICG